MAIFDDPKKALKHMEQELLAAEQDENAYDDEEFDIDIDFEDEEADWLDEAMELIDDRKSARPRNYAVDFDRTVYDDEEFDDTDAVFVEEPKKKGIGGLVLLAVLETLGIVAIVGWWLKWLM